MNKGCGVYGKLVINLFSCYNRHIMIVSGQTLRVRFSQSSYPDIFGGIFELSIVLSQTKPLSLGQLKLGVLLNMYFQLKTDEKSIQLQYYIYCP